MKDIQLTKGLKCTVDDEDFLYLNQYKWYAQKCGNYFYAARRERGLPIGIKRPIVLMHRQIIGATDDLVDHKNRNTLDNSRDNLRKCNRTENNRNKSVKKNSTSKYLGVTWQKSLNKWTAQIGLNGKKKHIGVFVCEIEAAKAYDRQALIHFGEYANFNFVVV